MNEWANYLFHTDFSEYGDVLTEIKPGLVNEEDGNILKDILFDKDEGEFKSQWNYTDAKEFSLQGAEVIHNGENSRSFATKSTMAKVLILKFPEDSIQPQDRIYIQYN